MVESELQSFIEKLIKNGNFLNSIDRTEATDPSIYDERNPHFVPAFPIDNLMRRECLIAADHVLSKLEDPEIVTTDRASISLQKGESLFPDLILHDVSSGSLILVELKRGNKTEREALTELLAYEHEVKNHFPFLSHLDVCLIVVATDFRPLLDHSIAGAVTWSGKQILCLHAIETSANGSPELSIDLKVRIPSVWRSIGQKPIPPQSLVTIDLSLYHGPNDSEEPPNEQLLVNLADTAMHIIARNGDRFGSHGFVMLWEDVFVTEHESRRYNLTIGMINPYHFFDEAVKTGFLNSDQSPLGHYVSKAITDVDICPWSSLMRRVCRQGISILEPHVKPTWETMSCWQEQRMPPGTAGYGQGLSLRAIPMSFEFWGVLGMHGRDLIASPAFRNTFNPLVGKYGLDWRHPLVGTELLDTVTGNEIVEHGRFTCKAIFRLGVEWASFHSIATNLALSESDEPGHFQAAVHWYGSLFCAGYREVGLRWRAMKEQIASPPTVLIGCEPGKPTVSGLEDALEWIANDFIGESEIHARCFDAGTKMFALMRCHFSENLAPDRRSDLLTQLTEFADLVFELTLEGSKVEGFDEFARQRIDDIMMGNFGLDLSTLDSSKNASTEVSDEDLIRGLSGSLLDLLDMTSPPLFHPLKMVESNVVDWNWIEREVREMRKTGFQNSGVFYSPDGGYCVADLGSVAAPFQYDLKTKVLVQLEIGGAFPVIMPMTWEDVRAGKLLDKFPNL